MQDAVEPIVPDLKTDHCPRCLQPVSPKVPRCLGCGQPIRSRRSLPLLIGAAGVLVLVFAVLLMYQLVSNEDAANAPLPVDDQKAQTQELFSDPPPNSISSEAAKPAKPSSTPEKRPPLNER
jgi:hypothetical protein